MLNVMPEICTINTLIIVNP